MLADAVLVPGKEHRRRPLGRGPHINQNHLQHPIQAGPDRPRSRARRRSSSGRLNGRMTASHCILTFTRAGIYHQNR